MATCCNKVQQFGFGLRTDVHAALERIAFLFGNALSLFGLRCRIAR